NMRIDRATRVSDVAFVSLASEERRSSAYVDGRLSVGVDVVRDSLGNTLSVSQDVRAAVEELREVLPAGVSVVITSDDGVFIEQSIGEVVSSIIMATMIVVLTIYAFLGSVRATIIPAIAIPVALVGSIATVWLAGFSINTITLLALVLATGLVVDDAIVVVENIVRKRREGMGPRAAALNGTGEVFFAVVSTTITLAAVFIPVSFLPGQAGSIFSEFGFVLAFCVALSSVAALVLAPVVAVMVDPGRFETREEAARAAGDSRMGKFFDWTVDRVIRSPFMVLAASISLAIIAFGIARDIPSEVTPPEDRGFFMIVARASAGDGVEAMDAAIADMEGIISRYRDAGLINAVQSFSGRGGGSSAFVIVRLTDWSERNASQHDVMAHLGQELAGIEGVTAFMRASNSLGIRGGSGGLSFAIAARDRSVIDASADLLINAMAQDPHFMSPQLSGVMLQPALEVDLDHDAAQDLGLDEVTLNTTLNAMLEGRTVASVFLDGEEIDIELVPGGGGIQDTGDLERVFLRARDGAYIPLSSVASPATLERQDRWPSVSAQTNLGAGVGMGVALTRLEELSREVLPAGSRLILLGEAAAIEEATQGFMLVFAVAFVIVLLVLAAQFESVTSALSIMITVPFGIAAAFIALWLTGSTLNYYSQIGLVLLVGVMAKNGILIVEFANQLRARGQGIDDAIRGAMRLRIRPVMMTMVSTVLGGLPLILSSGAGAEARAAVGWVIVGGLGFATIFTLTLTPAFYRLFSRFTATPGGAASALDRELDAWAAAQADAAK
ncbi:MAG TPA: efflux RND transporter permease subunit, partial [Paracoccus sp.]|nr:efflux RND transporter permease subunit [Paracoccus sp. (in: a-proteobacteria)]